MLTHPVTARRRGQGQTKRRGDMPGRAKACAPEPADHLLSRIGNRTAGALTAPDGDRPLPPGFRSEMEARFGTDFSSVTLGRQDDLPAAAVTEGEHIALMPGLDTVETPLGRRILAHELAHVVQQRTPGTERPTLDGSGALEAEARSAADSAVSGGAVEVSGASAPGPAAYSFEELLADANREYATARKSLSDTVDETIDDYVPDAVTDFAGDVSSTVSGAADAASDAYEDYVPEVAKDLLSEYSITDPLAPAKAAVKKYAPDLRRAVESGVSSYEDSGAPMSLVAPHLGPLSWAVDIADQFTDGEASQTAREVQGGVVIAGYSIIEGLALAAADPEATAMGLLKLSDTVAPVNTDDVANTAELLADLAGDEVGALEAFERFEAAQTTAREERMNTQIAMGKALLENYTNAADEGRWGRIPGLLAVDIGSLFFGGPATKGGTASKTAQVAKVGQTAKATGLVGKFKGLLGFGDDAARVTKLADEAADVGKLAEAGGDTGKVVDAVSDTTKASEGALARTGDEASDAGRLGSADEAGKLTDEAAELADVIPINRGLVDRLPQVLDDGGELIMGLFDEAEPRMASGGDVFAGPRRPRAPGSAGAPRKPRVANDVGPRPPSPMRGGAQRGKARPPARSTKADKAVDKALDQAMEPPGKTVPDRPPDRAVEVETRLPGNKDPTLSKAASDKKIGDELGLKVEKGAGASKGVNQVKELDTLMGQPLSKAFPGAWDRALGKSKAAQTKMAEANKLLDKAAELRADGKLKAAAKAEKKAQKLAAGAYKNTQPNFWPEVYADPSNIKRLEDAGLTIDKTVKNGKAVPDGTAPYLKPKKGKPQKVTLEHSDRKADAPRKAVDPDGLVLSLSRENSVFLEAIRREMRRRMKELGMPGFKDWPGKK